MKCENKNLTGALLCLAEVQFITLPASMFLNESSVKKEKHQFDLHAQTFSFFFHRQSIV